MSAARAAIALLDPELPLFDVHAMEERIDASLPTRRTSLLLSASFGLIALFLAALGVYGVLAYLVSQRTREIGIRMALGSTARSTFELVVREGAAIVGLGLSLGLVGVLALGRVLENELYGVTAAEPAVLVSVAGALAAVALVASVIPARRASRINPVAALRGDGTATRECRRLHVRPFAGIPPTRRKRAGLQGGRPAPGSATSSPRGRGSFPRASSG